MDELLVTVNDTEFTFYVAQTTYRTSEVCMENDAYIDPLDEMGPAELLRLSCCKWYFIVQQCRKGGAPFDGGTESCALCQVYYEPNECTHCEFCPVRKSTGETDCYDTPYYRYRFPGSVLSHLYWARKAFLFLNRLRRKERRRESRW